MSERVVGFLAEKAEGILENRRGWKDALSFQEEIKALGSASHVIGNNRGEASLASVLQLADFSPEQTALTMVDWDGPMGSPMRTVCQYLSDRTRGLVSGSTPAELIKNLKEQGRVGYDNFKALGEIAHKSTKTVVSTSRFSFPQKLLGFFKDKIDIFPFLSKPAAKKLERLGKGKLEVRTNKPLLTDPGKIIDQYFFDKSGQPRYDRLYLVISSRKDRRAVKGFLKRHPTVAGQTVCFDTAGWFL